MSVLVYIEHAEGSVKKTSLEAISYGKALSEKLSAGEVVAVALGTISSSSVDVGDYLTVDIVSVGSSFAGANLVVTAEIL